MNPFRNTTEESDARHFLVNILVYVIGYESCSLNRM